MTDQQTAEKPARSAPKYSGGIVVVAICAALWWPSFTLGAWGTLFFDQSLTVWAVSTAAFIVVLLQPRPYRRRAYRATVLLVPSLWLILNLADPPGEGDVLTVVVDVLALLIALVGIPFSLLTLVQIMWPDFGTDLSRARRLISVGGIAVVIAASFLLGANNARFLTCEDFTLSGNSEPPGCVHDTGG